MRAAAALSVLVYHFSIQFIAAGGSENHWFYYLFNQIGYAGVDFFFVISGYIMWITTKTTRINHPVMKFCYKRATRIYLGYWPYFLLAVVIISFFPNLISNKTNLTGSFFLTELETPKLLIQVAWTLQFELYFYCLFAFLLLFSKNNALKIIWSLSALVVIFHFYSQQNNSDIHLISNNNLIHFLLSPFCLEFFAGCFLGHFFQTRRLIHLPVALLIGLATLVFAIYYQENVINTSLIGSNHTALRILIFGTSAVSLLAAMIELEMRGRVY